MSTPSTPKGGAIIKFSPNGISGPLCNVFRPFNQCAKGSHDVIDILVLYKLLGNGSIVRKCRSKTSDPKDFAVKILELTDASEEDVEDLLLSTSKEIACMRLCRDHPNICKIEESFLTQSYIFLVMELCDGGN